MTSTRFSLMLFSALLALSVFSCSDKCEDVREFVRYEPVYVSQEVYERAVSYEGAREVEASGVIVGYGDYLFVNEYNSGIHVINNSDPANPINEGFLVVNNNKHFSIKDGILLANRYGDLVSVDINDVNNVRELNRELNVFPDESNVTEEGILSHYEQTSEVVTRDCDDPFFNNWWWEDEDILVNRGAFNNPIMSSADANAFQAQGPGTSVGSSTARFTITGNTLYVLGQGTLEVFNVSSPSIPQRSNSINVGPGVETLFPLNEYLFIGANNGMSIYDISNPNTPQFLSNFEHAFSCDPVVANNQNAFVTLRTGNNCVGFTNQLDVVDIRNISFPNLVSSHVLDNPRGLTLVGNNLFVCDGPQGLVVFDIQDESNVHQIGRYTDREASDVLPVSESVIVVSGENGIYELNITDPAQPSLLSVVTTK